MNNSVCKVILLKVPDTSNLSLNAHVRDYILAYLRLMGNVYVNERDTEVEYNSLHRFYSVRVYKNCRSRMGHGTSESREKDWVNLQNCIEDLYHIRDKRHSWRWAHTQHHTYREDWDPISESYMLDTPEPGYMPGITYFIPEQPCKCED